MTATNANPFRAMLDVGSALVSSVELDEVFANVARTFGETMMVSGVEIFSVDRERSTFLLEARWSLGETAAASAAVDRVPFPVAERPDLMRVLSIQDPVERRLDAKMRPGDGHGVHDAGGAKSILDAPLAINREVLGVMSLIETRFARTWAPLELDLLLQLCGLATVSIRNAYLLRERDQRAQHAQLLLNVGRAIASSLQLEDVLRTVCLYVGEAMDVSSCDIQLYHKSEDRLVYAACWDHDPSAVPTLVGSKIDPDERPSNRLALKGTPIECRIDDPDLGAAERAEMERWAEKSTIDYPLAYDDQVIGIVGLIDREKPRRFTMDEHALFEQMGMLAAIAIHNAQVVQELKSQNRILTSLLDLRTRSDAGERGR